MPRRSFSAPPSAFSAFASANVANSDYDSDPEPDTLPSGYGPHHHDRQPVTMPPHVHHQPQCKIGYTPARMKLWADYLCNADTPFSYSSTVHHPEHFDYVPTCSKQQPIASADGAAVAGAGGNAAAIAAAKAMSQPKKNKRCSNTAGLDGSIAPTAVDILERPSPQTVVGGKIIEKHVAKRQRYVPEHASTVNAAVFPIVHYIQQNDASSLGADDDQSTSGMMDIDEI